MDIDPANWAMLGIRSWGFIYAARDHTGNSADRQTIWSFAQDGCEARIESQRPSPLGFVFDIQPLNSVPKWCGHAARALPHDPACPWKSQENRVLPPALQPKMFPLGENLDASGRRPSPRT